MSLASILQQLHAPGNPSFDDRVLLSILLCLAAGERNLVLRLGSQGEQLTASEKKDWVQRVGEEVAWICGTIFALTTHRVPCTTSASPTRFLRSLFIPATPIPSSPSRSEGPTGVQNGGSESLGGSKKGASTKSRSNSLSFEVLASTADPPQRSPTTSTFAKDSPVRRASILGPTSTFTYEPTSILDNGDSSAGEDLYPFRPLTTRSPSPERRRKSIRRHTINAVAANKRTTEGGPLKTPTTASVDFSTSRAGPVSPTRLVARSATIREVVDAPAMRNRRATVGAGRPMLIPPSVAPPTRLVRRASNPPSLVLGTNTSTPRSPTSNSQPASFKSGSAPSSRRDAFRRLSTITPDTPTILPQVLILERLEKTRPSVQQALLDTLRERRIHLSSGSRTSKRAPLMDDGASARTRRTENGLLEAEASRGWEGNFILPSGFFIVAIVCSEDPAYVADPSWGGISRYLLDHFSISHSIPASTLFQLPPTYPLAPIYHPLLPIPRSLLSPAPLLLSSLPPIHPNLSNFISDVLSALRNHPLLEGRMLTSRSCTELPLFVRIWVSISRGNESVIVPKDVVAMVLGVLGHRLRMREARDEKSVFWGSELRSVEANEAREGGVEGVVRDVVGLV